MVVKRSQKFPETSWYKEKQFLADASKTFDFPYMTPKYGLVENYLTKQKYAYSHDTRQFYPL